MDKILYLFSTHPLTSFVYIQQINTFWDHPEAPGLRSPLYRIDAPVENIWERVYKTGAVGPLWTLLHHRKKTSESISTLTLFVKVRFFFQNTNHLIKWVCRMITIERISCHLNRPIGIEFCSFCRSTCFLLKLV